MARAFANWGWRGRAPRRSLALVARGAALALCSAGAWLLGARVSAPSAPRAAGLALAAVVPQTPVPTATPPRPKEAVPLEPLVMSEREPYFPFLAGENTKKAVSVGDAATGVLVNGHRLEETKAIGILPSHRDRNLRYGSEPIMLTLEHAAAELFRQTGTRMWVGNISKKGGGNISYSASHNSGRDADVAFCYRDQNGNPVDPPDLVRLDASGWSADGKLQFDIERTWIVLKALATTPHAEVQYLFLARPLEEKLLFHAKKKNEPRRLRRRVEDLLRRPKGTGPHDDHLHLRVYCGERDVAGGCQNGGILHPWAELHETKRTLAVDRCIDHLDHGEPAERRRALERLVLLDDHKHPRALISKLDDGAPEVRAAAARALGSLGASPHVMAFDKRFANEDEVAVKVALLAGAGDLGGRYAGEFLARAVREAALPRGKRSAAARAVALAALEAAARARRLEPVPALVELLGDEDGAIRAGAAQALMMATNHGDTIAWATADADSRRRGVAEWRLRLRQHRGDSHGRWLVAGFRLAGLHVRELSRKYVWEIVAAVGGADHLSFNAQHVLMDLTDHRPPTLSWPKGEACTYWVKYINGRLKSFAGLGGAPGATVAACKAAK
jgi:penicillin-insensitive murein endopeptidase